MQPAKRSNLCRSIRDSTAANDALIGSRLNNSLIDGAGNDSFTGGEGHETLNGQGGADLLASTGHGPARNSLDRLTTGALDRNDDSFAVLFDGIALV